METKRERIERQIENILVAKAMMDSLPDSAIYPKLDYWNNWDMVPLGHNHCGAAACFGGWVAVHPHFRKQGISIGAGGQPELSRSTYSAAEELFGSCEAGNVSVFSPNISRRSDRNEIDRRLQVLLDNRLNALRRLEAEENIQFIGGAQ